MQFFRIVSIKIYGMHSVENLTSILFIKCFDFLKNVVKIFAKFVRANSSMKTLIWSKCGFCLYGG
jgi:hypothetical protein